ncbi:MAG: hypothetical protein R3F56_06255 [Planctomycetota bacterium]
MTSRRSTWAVFLLVPLAPLAAQDPDAPHKPTVAELVSQLQQRERAAKTVSLSMRSRSAVPDGPSFETTGTLRVLGTTHFHVSMRMKIGEGMEGEQEVVRTPGGTWTREVDPMQGEVITKMSKETMAALEDAAKVLGDDVPAGAVPGQSEAPLGSAMLASLAKRFQLEVANKLVRDGIDHWVVRGDLRADALSAGEDDGLPRPDRVELLVRASADGPLAVVKMSQFSQGVEVMTVEIDSVVLDEPMTEASFKIDDRGRKVIDVMEHPPAALQIQAVLDQAKRKKEGAAAGKDPGPDRGR